MEDIIQNEVFLGFENDRYIATGLGFGGVSHHPVLKALLKQYDPLLDGRHGIITCPQLNTEALRPLGLVTNGQAQNVSGAQIYSREYFNPYDDPTGRLEKTENTVSIHWYSKSWMSKSTIIRSKITQPLHRLFGVDCFKWIKQIIKKES